MTGLSVKRQVLTDKLYQSQQLIRKIPHFYGQVMTDVKKQRRSRSSKMFILSHPPHITSDTTRDITRDTTDDITDDITSDTTSNIDARGC